MFPNTSIATLQNAYENKLGNVSEVVDDLIGEPNWDELLEGLYCVF